MTKKDKIRLDDLVYLKKMSDSKSQAKSLILAGKVMLGTVKLEKPGQTFSKDTPIKVISRPKFVSRAGEKLEAYINHYKISLLNKNILDIGASTGGFTDCCLQKGSNHSTCVDVGKAQLHNKLIQDPRVINLNNTNARYLKKEDLPFESYPIIVIDLSFISLKKVLPQVWSFLEENGRLIALIKPQFEAKKSEVDLGKGIIKDSKVHQRIIDDIIDFCLNELKQSKLIGMIESPIQGTKGNKEFLVGLEKASNDK